MIYQAFDLNQRAMAQASVLARAGSAIMANPFNLFAYTEVGSLAAAALDVFAHSTSVYGKPAFGLATTSIDGRDVKVIEEVIVSKPFGNLMHFKRDTDRQDPSVLIVAPMSGHYATLLRGTVAQMLPDHDVYITDWSDARLVSLLDGHFDLDDYIDYIVEFLSVIGPDTHVVAVCQPTVPCFAAVALMNADGHPATPPTLTMMGGPIDTREAPTEVNRHAETRPLSWFEQNVIMRVPVYYPGAFRRVYPGFMQLAGFMSMNLGNHMMSHWNMFRHLVRGDQESADATKAFYEEYRSVCDMTAEFYLQTVEVVFKEHALPRGQMRHRDRLVDPRRIRRTSLLAIEGERDDISGLGQTRAALGLATRLPDDRKKYFMAEGAGHYGIFNGKRWREIISPVVKAFIRQHRQD